MTNYLIPHMTCFVLSKSNGPFCHQILILKLCPGGPKFFPDPICNLIWAHAHPGRPGHTSVTPGVPIRAPKWPKTPPIYTHFLTHLLQWFKSHRCDPKFLPRPNLPLHLISSKSREATLYICDPSGPHQSPKMTKNTPKIDAFSPASF